MRYLALLSVLVFASPVLAADGFHKEVACTSAAQVNTVANTAVTAVVIRKGSIIYWCQDATAELFYAYTKWKLEYDPGTDTAGTDVGEIFLESCIGPTSHVNNCERVLVDSNGSGGVDNLPLNGDPGNVVAGSQRRWITDIEPGWYRLIQETDNTTDPAVATLTSLEAN